MKNTEISTDKNKIKEVLTRGVEDVFVKENLEKRLLSGEKMRIKLGIDPTGPKIHIGRAVVLRKLKAFQDLGHQVVFIVGDFTAQIGDPSDKTEKRPMLSSEDIQENLKDYLAQAGKIIDVQKAEIHYNSKWLSKLGFQEICQLAESFSVQQMSNRRNFKDRFDKGVEVSLREFMYPLMQGYDSVEIKADVELGGFDQLFNLKAGRIIQKHYEVPEQDVLTVQMLEGTDGRKMSTSWGNVITIVDEPNDMFGKIMSVRDDLIKKYFLLCTEIPEEEILKKVSEMGKGVNPRDVKMELASEIIKIYHGEAAAKKAQENFIETFKKGGMPEDIKTVMVDVNTPLVDVLLQEGIVKSKTEFRTLEKEGAITANGKRVIGPDSKIDMDADLKVGKRRFIRVKLNK